MKKFVPYLIGLIGFVIAMLGLAIYDAACPDRYSVWYNDYSEMYYEYHKCRQNRDKQEYCV